MKDIADDIDQGEQDAFANEVLTGGAKERHTDKRKRAGDLLNMPQSRQHLAESRAIERPGGVTKKLKTEDDEPDTNAPNADDERDGDSQLQITASLVADLFESVFDSKWEVRHGALLALRQIFLSSQLIQSLATAAKTTSASPVSSLTTEKWLEECLVRCICVLALDQFVDYSADGSVSPVREVCAQVFGVLLGNLPRDEQGLLVAYLEILRTLFQGATWHACHGGLLGLKYLVLAHKAHAQTLIPLFYADVLSAFEKRQAEEEVMVLAAEMFEDFTVHLEQTSHTQLQKTAKLLWKALAEHVTSGLVPACVVRGLSAWYNHAPLRTTLDKDEELAKLTRLSLHHVVPLLHQPIRAVRLSAVVCVAAMFQGNDGSAGLTNSAFERYLLPHLLLQLLKEQDAEVRLKLLSAWKRAVQSCSERSVLVAAISTELATWIDLLWSTADMKLLDVEYQTRPVADNDAIMVATDPEVSSASRVAFADAIGFLGAHVPFDASVSDEIVQKLSGSLRSASGERQCGALLTISRWAFYEKQQLKETGGAEVPSRLLTLQKTLGPALESLAQHEWVVQLQAEDSLTSGALTFYSEQRGLLKRIRVMETRIIEVFAANGVTTCRPTTTTTAAQASAADISRQIAENVVSFPYNILATSPEAFELAHFKRQDLFLVDESIQQSFARFYHRVQGLGSCAFSNLLAIPPKKSGFLVKALMDSIKQEQNADFQQLTAQTMADFVVSQAKVQRKCVAKIVSNLCNSAVALAFAQSDQGVAMSNDLPSQSTSGGQLLSLEVLQKAKVRVEGAENALRTICDVAGGRIFDICPTLYDIVLKSWTTSTQQEDHIVQQSSHLVCVLVPSVHQVAFLQCLEWLKGLATLVTQPFKIVHTRATVANAIASICRHAICHQESAMLLVYQHVFAVFTQNSSPSTEGQEALMGATMVLHHLVKALSVELTPYIPSLVHFSMKTMSSQNAEVRSLAARAFADLVPLVPLQMDLQVSSSGDGVNGGALRDIVGQNQVSREFLENLLEGKAVKHVEVGGFLADGVTLRSYQQHGVDWLSFLVENNLHGILADDMGLGKTLVNAQAYFIDCLLFAL